MHVTFVMDCVCQAASSAANPVKAGLAIVETALQMALQTRSQPDRQQDWE